MTALHVFAAIGIAWTGLCVAFLILLGFVMIASRGEQRRHLEALDRRLLLHVVGDDDQTRTHQRRNAYE